MVYDAVMNTIGGTPATGSNPNNLTNTSGSFNTSHAAVRGSSAVGRLATVRDKESTSSGFRSYYMQQKENGVKKDVSTKFIGDNFDKTTNFDQPGSSKSPGPLQPARSNAGHEKFTPYDDHQDNFS